MEARIIESFKTPIFVFGIANSEALNGGLVHAIRDWMSREPQGAKRSNSGGWHSPSTLQSEKNEHFRALTKLVYEAVLGVSKHLNEGFKSDDWDVAMEGWVNVNKRGDYNRPHIHPNYLWSACYYIKVPKQESEDGGRLAFLSVDGRNSLGHWRDPLGAYFKDQTTILPSEGALIVFPAFLHHFVTPNSSDSERITAAFNINFRKK